MKIQYQKPKSEEELINLVKQIALNIFNFKVEVPIVINTRMTAYNGKIYSKIENGKYKLLKFEFAKWFLYEDYPLSNIINVIKHELVHWYTDSSTNSHNGHNQLFINNCSKFKVTDETNFEKYKPRKRLGKNEYYEAKCCNCNRVVAKSKNFKHLHDYMNRWGGTVCSCSGNGDRYYFDKGVKIIVHHGIYPVIDKRTGKPMKKEEEWLDDLAKSFNVILCKEG